MFIKEIKYPNIIDEDLAIATGMLIGDGSMPRKHNGDGKRNYLLYFGNTNKNLVIFFSDKIRNLFGLKGKIFRVDRDGKKPFYTYYCYSKNIVLFFINLGVDDGKKAIKVRVPNKILKSNKRIRSSLLKGLIITDGSIKADKTLMFHCASEGLLSDINRIISQDTTVDSKIIKKFIQGKFTSYQLSYKRGETEKICSYARVA